MTDAKGRATPETKTAGASPLRIMTWNIHGCVGVDRRRDPARVAALIAAVAPDVVALQEIDIRPGHGDPVPLLERIAEVAGQHRSVTYTIEVDERSYGIALFSRWPIASADWHDLAFKRREPRRAIDATIAAPCGPVRVVATHFGLAARERDQQIARLRLAIGRPVSEPTLLLGDFNDWRLPGAVGRLFGGDFPGVFAPRSFPSRLPVFPLDRIFASSHFDLKPLIENRPWIASDHRAVVADVVRRHEAA